MRDSSIFHLLLPSFFYFNSLKNHSKKSTSVTLLQKQFHNHCRLRTIECVESLGAWSKIREQENNKRKEHFKNGGVTPLYVHVPDERTYCVVIAVKGRILYPRSVAVKSFSQVIRCNLRLLDECFIAFTAL